MRVEMIVKFDSGIDLLIRIKIKKSFRPIKQNSSERKYDNSRTE